MAIAKLQPPEVEFRPGLILGQPEPPAVPDAQVRTDVGCFLRVRNSPVPFASELFSLPSNLLNMLQELGADRSVADSQGRVAVVLPNARRLKRLVKRMERAHAGRIETPVDCALTVDLSGDGPDKPWTAFVKDLAERYGAALSHADDDDVVTLGFTDMDRTATARKELEQHVDCTISSPKRGCAILHSPFTIQQLLLDDLPGSEEEGEQVSYVIRHRQMDEWREDVFAGEYRTRQPALARQFFLNGGKTLHIVDLLFHVPPFDPMGLAEDQDPAAVEEAREDAAVLAFYSWALERSDDYGRGSINQYAFPELWLEHPHLVPRIWGMAATFCKRTGNRFFIGDAAPPWDLLEDAERQRQTAAGHLAPAELAPRQLVGDWFRAERWAKPRFQDVPRSVELTIDAMYATQTILSRSEVDLSCLGVYSPWLVNERGLPVPPCGAVAGIYARSDWENAPVGVMKPPANEVVKGVADLALQIDEFAGNLLQRASVNSLQSRAGRGVLVWGARTQCDDPQWQYINVRRLIGFIGKQLERESQWAVFEPNTRDLRGRVRTDIRYFLKDLWELGALDGETPEQAFKVICDEQNNSSAVVDAGMLVADIWVRPVQTNEFVHLQLAQGDASEL